MVVHVYVWLEKSGCIGHSSMLAQKQYISYWPKRGSKKVGLKDFVSNITHQPKYSESYEEDYELEGKRNAKIIGPLNNLNEKAIKDKWRSIREEGIRYNLKSHNCSTVIISCLKVGSGLKPSQKQKNTATGNLGDFFGVWTPEDVLHFAEKIMQKIG
jgi:DNA modification methylase